MTNKTEKIMNEFARLVELNKAICLEILQKPKIINGLKVPQKHGIVKKTG